MNRTLCEEDNTMLIQKRDEKQFSGLTNQISPVNWVFLQRAFQLSIVKPKSE